MGSVWERGGVRVGPGHLKGEKDKQSMPSNGEDNMEKDKEEQSRT
jgi:hypothetical protein